LIISQLFDLLGFKVKKSIRQKFNCHTYICKLGGGGGKGAFLA